MRLHTETHFWRYPPCDVPKGVFYCSPSPGITFPCRAMMPSMVRPQYIIEHMEDLDADADSPATFPRWALLEYRHMLALVGAGSTVHFTGLVSAASRDALHKALASPEPAAAAASSSSSSAAPAAPAQHEVHVEGILDFAKQHSIALRDICLLDPRSPALLSVADAGKHATTSSSTAEGGGGATGPFRYFLFGGILGDDPPRDRTGALRAMGFPTRHLGSVQMTTDTALGVTKRVVEDGVAMNLPPGETKLQRQKQREKDAQKAAAAGTSGASVPASRSQPAAGTPDDGDDDIIEEAWGPGGAMDWITHPELLFGGGESVRISAGRQAGSAPRSHSLQCFRD